MAKFTNISSTETIVSASVLNSLESAVQNAVATIESNFSTASSMLFGPDFNETFLTTNTATKLVYTDGIEALVIEGSSLPTYKGGGLDPSDPASWSQTTLNASSIKYTNSALNDAVLEIAGSFKVTDGVNLSVSRIIAGDDALKITLSGKLNVKQSGDDEPEVTGKLSKILLDVLSDNGTPLDTSDDFYYHAELGLNASSSATSITFTSLKLTQDGVATPLLNLTNLGLKVTENATDVSLFTGNDNITGTSGNDFLDASTGNDKVQGGVGDDAIFGGDGNDQLVGGAGNDFLDGGTGNDKIKDTDGNNVVFDEEGNASVTTGAGNDEITTGAGNDKIAAGDGNNEIRAGDGNNKVTAGVGNDTVFGGAGKDKIATGAGDDTVLTGGEADSIQTGDGTDAIDAGAGNDSVNAGAGNDTIIGGAGADKLAGGLGADTFVFDNLADGGTDSIGDFADEDILAFDVDVFTSLAGATADDFYAVGTIWTGTAESHLLYTAKGQLYYDANGDDGLTGVDSDAVLIATIKGADAKTLTFDDFGFIS